MNTRRCALTLMLFVAVALAGCDQSALLTETTTEAPVVTAKLAPAASYTLTGFATPESALYDPVADVYYVSNVGAPLKDGDGFVSRIDPSATGDVSDDPGFVWIGDLNSPFGMALDGNTLYVVDRDGLYVYEINRETGDADQTGFIELGRNGSLLNDVCIAEGGPDRGSAYVTDTGLDLATFLGTGTDAIYEIDVESGSVSKIVNDAEEEGPNGCLTNGANVYWTTFKANKVYRTNPSGKQFEVATLPTGGLDSVVRNGGTLYVSSWNADPADPPTGIVYSMSMGGSRVRTLIGSVLTPGDLGYDTARDRLLVPSVFGGEVIVKPLR